MENSTKAGLSIFGGILLIVVGLIIAFTTAYITPEGHVDVVKRFSKASYVAEPGLNFKAPLVDTTTTIELRTRKNTEEMTAATSEQMPVVVIASMNWTAKKTDIMNLFIKYGSLEQFETRVIDPMFRSIVKESVAKYKAEETIGKRDIVTAKVRDALVEAFKDLPIEVSAINIENIKLPDNYLKSIETKQTEKNLADAEIFKLEKQNLEAKRAINIADAQKESAMKIADGNAYAIEAEAKANAAKVKLLGDAEASAIKAKSVALANNPLLIELIKAQNWNGSYLTTGIGQGTNVLMDIREKQ